MPTAGLSDRIALGIGMTLGAYFLFSLLDTSTKWLIGAGFAALQLAFLRYFGHFVVSVVEAIVKRGGLPHVEQRLLPMVLLRGSFLVVSTVGNFLALKFLPLTITSAIMFSAPIILCFLAGPMLGERVGPWRSGAIFVGFLGVLVVIQPFGETFHWAAILSLFNALCMALYSILTRKLAGQVSAGAMQFYSGAIGTFALLIPAMLTWVPSSDPLILLLWVSIGILGWAGHELLTRAHSFAPASTLMPFSYSFLLYLILLSFLVFAHIPSFATLLGAAIIVVAGLVIWMRERIHKEQ